METLKNILPYIQIILSVLLIISILLQQSGNELGGAFGGGDNFSSKHTRRGIEKTLFNITITLAVLFVISAFVALIL
ncbi:preprotein translocase subunit SecG [Candidatus Parcubacteria bacterium]|nr:preprotein translocase subunit SecG [Candidatus Parcubacteria bacterium]